MPAILKCTRCGADLTISVGYTGADWDCLAGENSGYGYELSLDCRSCGAVHKLGHLKNHHDLSPTVEGRRSALIENKRSSPPPPSKAR